ncbi:hypothetical protein SARC_06008 [Sphaeroforma arctica JP610]|uniref:ZZ-type domain-containing protein n=1 Tax=Sphaeroforma arctica JP610 TaxID=667725 RepID=A0A0L0G0E6_9EUKA|nr:hypothetical protein SARC_06008 [Sphaeroforma arctica JP610]KNC81678.1 hypothetical protein SARC_06008 [Sphaeroforma arctica JP610]|eukprot:XP_014155580.1 hypothetical protein SARC_06008 [Sphaeroforma arctica JP610]
MTSIKVINGQSDVRRLKVDNWADAASQIRSRFDAQDFTAKYVDEDGDHVTISTEDDFQEALDESKGTLRVLLTNVASAARTDSVDAEGAPTPVEVVDFDDVDDTVLVEAIEELIVEPTIEEPEVVQPVVESDAEEMSAQQATVEAMEPDEESKNVSEKEKEANVAVSDANESTESKTESVVDEEEEQRAPKPLDFLESLFRGMEGMGHKDGDRVGDDIASVAEKWAQNAMPGIMDSLVGNLANMQVPEGSGSSESSECDCQGCECEGEKCAETSEGAENGERVHSGITCDVCDKTVVGNRYKCQDCVNFDLCEPCFQTESHDESHALLMLRLPRLRQQRSRRGPWNYGPQEGPRHPRHRHHGKGHPRYRHHGDGHPHPPHHGDGHPHPPPHHGDGHPHPPPRGHPRPPHHGKGHPHPPPPPPHFQHFGPRPPHMMPGGPPIAHMFSSGPHVFDGLPNMFGGMFGGADVHFGGPEVHFGGPQSGPCGRRGGRGPPPPPPAPGMDPIASFMNAMFSQQGRGNSGYEAMAKPSGKKCGKPEKKECHKQKTADATSVPAKSAEVASEKNESVETESVPERTTTTTASPRQEECMVVESVAEVEDDEYENSSSADCAGATTAKGNEKNLDIMHKLYDMGFTDRSLNAAYIRMYGSDISEIANRLTERK